jgi:thiamine-monophosphate kinase
MDERDTLRRLGGELEAVGDDAAVVDRLALTTDMLHESTDFSDGTTRYTAGWRAVGASLSDIAAMGGEAVAAVAVYGAPTFDWDAVHAFVEGARDVCEGVGAEYVGGDLDGHDEFTVACTALGRVDDPVWRSGASPGEVVCVTGSLGRSAAALELFRAGEQERANDLFQFSPRITAGQTLRAYATAMMDSSDGLARSLHQLAEHSECGFAIESPLPFDPALEAVAETDHQRREWGTSFGEDFELVCTLPENRVSTAQDELDVRLTPIGTVTSAGVTLDGEPLADSGYTH